MFTTEWRSSRFSNQHAMEMLCAKAAVDTKWTTLENIQLGSSTVKPKDEVICKTLQEGRKVKFTGVIYKTQNERDEKFTGVIYKTQNERMKCSIRFSDGRVPPQACGTLQESSAI